MAFIKKLSVGYEKCNKFEQEVKINQLPFICSMWTFSDVFIVNLEQISQIVLEFPFLTWHK